MLEPLKWNTEKSCVEIIDQRLLPYEFKYIEIHTLKEMVEAIRDMALRGAPLIGISAAFGILLGFREFFFQVPNDVSKSMLLASLSKADEILRSTRPTAVNLMWALDEMKTEYETWIHELNLDRFTQEKLQELDKKLLNKAIWILIDDIFRSKTLSEKGADYISKKFPEKKLRVMTHCNAGALATGGYGTALGVIRSLHARNLIEMVYSNETRPRQQGSRLTVWELAYDGIPVTMNTDNMAGYLMQLGLVDLVITGADRIAANGDSANKIGTYSLAILAKYHKIPFYIAAPKSTIDNSIPDGSYIPIENRDPKELSHINGKACTYVPEEFVSELKNHKFGEVSFVNPGFDVVPRVLIEEIFTENSILF
jgi:methylthioribose-1-phosphate isomerase